MNSTLVMQSPGPGRRLDGEFGRAGSRDGAVGFHAARRLAHELESLEATLVAAEKAALACRPSRTPHRLDPHFDVSSRRAELERREHELQERERAVERQRMLLEQAQEKLLRGKESLKRAIRKFRAQVTRRSDELDARDRRLAELHSELREAKREFVRDQIRMKVVTRETFLQSAPSALEEAVALG